MIQSTVIEPYSGWAMAISRSDCDSAFEQRQVHAADCGERGHGVAAAQSRLAANPAILVECLRGVVRSGQRHPGADAERQLRLREVRHDLARRPLAGRVGPLEVGRAPAACQRGEPRAAVAHHRQRLAIAQVLRVVGRRRHRYTGACTTVFALRCASSTSGDSLLLKYTFDCALSTWLRSYLTTSNRR